MNFNTPFWQKRVFQLVMATSGLFVLLTAVAMLVYPGGSVHNPEQVGYAFMSNFFSDLGLIQAHNGQANWLSAGLFFIALSAAGVGLIIFFIAFTQFFRNGRVGRFLSLAGSGIGVFAGISFIGIAFTPADLLRAAHIQFVLYAFQGLLAAALFYGGAILAERSYPRRLGAIFGLFILLLAGYVALLRGGPPPSTPEGAAIQVAGQKIIVYAAVLTVMIQAWGADNLLKR